MRFLIRATSSEGKLNLAAIHTAEAAYYTMFDTFIACAASPPASPGPKVPYQTATAAEGFDVLGWVPEGPVAFQYSVVTNAGPPSTAFTASAQANLDGDADRQSWGYVQPVPNTAVGVNGAGTCDDTSGQSRF